MKEKKIAEAVAERKAAADAAHAHAVTVVAAREAAAVKKVLVAARLKAEKAHAAAEKAHAAARKVWRCASLAPIT